MFLFPAESLCILHISCRSKVGGAWAGSGDCRSCLRLQPQTQSILVNGNLFHFLWRAGNKTESINLGYTPGDERWEMFVGDGGRWGTLQESTKYVEERSLSPSQSGVLVCVVCMEGLEEGLHFAHHCIIMLFSC